MVQSLQDTVGKLQVLGDLELLLSELKARTARVPKDPYCRKVGDPNAVQLGIFWSPEQLPDTDITPLG